MKTPFRLLVLAATSAAALVAGAAVGAAADAPVRGGDMTVSITSQPKSLDPLFGDAPSVDTQIYNLIYDPLVRLAADGSLGPGLADSWKFNAAGDEVVFDLHKGIKFQDGTPFTAAAVVYQIDRLLSKEVNSPRSTDVADVASAEAIGDYQVRVNLKNPSGAFLAAMAAAPGMIASPTALKKYGKDYGRNPVGTGPMKFVSWQSGGHVKLARNVNYWRNGADGKPLPYLDGVTVRFITQTAVKLVEIESGNIDIVDDIQPRDFKKLDDNPKVELFDAGGIEQWMAFNITKPPFDDIRLRKAVLYALDRDKMLKIVAGKYGKVIPCIVYPREFFYAPDIDIYKYDPEKSKSLLKEAGYGDKTFAPTLTLIQRDPDTTVAQIVQAQLKAVGIDIKLELVERQAFIAKNRSKKHDVSMGRVDIPRGDPDQTFGAFFGRDAYQRGGAGLPVIYDLVDKGRQEVDQAKRRATYIEAQKEIIDNALYAWLFMRDVKHAKRTSVKNLETTPTKVWLLEKVWLQK